MDYKVISNTNKINKQAWSEFVSNHPNSNFFQIPDFVDLINSVPNYKAGVISHIEKNKIMGILVYTEQKEGSGLKGYFTNRCIVYGGPLVLNGEKEDEIAGTLLEKLKEQTGVIYIEFRNLFNTSSLKNTFESCNYSYQPHLNNIVPISPEPEETILLLNSSRRRQVIKSLKSGAEIINPSSVEEVQEFYKILFKLYKHKIKKPLPPWAFFKKFYIKQNIGKYFLIRFDGEIIGGIMCPIYRNTVYEWYIAGMDGIYKNIYPSVLATWAPMEYAAKNRLKYFDFMGAGKPDTDYGVREFKSKFGGKEIEYGRYLLINKPALYKVGRFLLWFYKMIK